MSDLHSDAVEWEPLLRTMDARTRWVKVAGLGGRGVWADLDAMEDRAHADDIRGQAALSGGDRAF